MILLNLIPDSWTIAPIKELGIIQTGNTPSKKDESNYGDYIPLVKPPELNDQIIDDAHDHLSKKGAGKARILSEDSVLVSCIGNLGKTAMNKKPVAFNQQINSVTFYEGIHSKYGFYYFQSPFARNQLEDLASATTIPIVNKTKFSNIQFPIAPYNEQVRIVGRVEEHFSWLDAGVRSLQAAQTQLEQYRQTTLRQAYTGKISCIIKDTTTSKNELENLRNRTHEKVIELRKRTRKRTYGELDAIRYEILPEIPENWVWSRLEECVFVIDYRGKTPPFAERGVPNIRSSNVKNGKIIWDDMKYITENTYEKWMTRGTPQEKDILFTTEAPLGDIAFVPKLKFSIAQRVIILRAMEILLEPKFLFYQLMSPDFKDRLTGKGTGTTVTGISYRNFRNLELATPPISEQKQIVSKMEESVSIVENIQKSLNYSFRELPKIKQSILKKAFEGRLVPQNPNDEPASLLLERIGAQKVKQRKLM